MLSRSQSMDSEMFIIASVEWTKLLWSNMRSALKYLPFSQGILDLNQVRLVVA